MAVDRERYNELKARNFKKHTGSARLMRGSDMKLPSSKILYASVLESLGVISSRSDAQGDRLTKNHAYSSARQIKRDTYASTYKNMDSRTRYKMQRFYNGLSVG